MRFLKILLGLLVVLVLVFFVGAYLLPDRVRVERSIEIQRPAASVFAVVNDLSRFNDWSPWHGLDPNAEYRSEGPDSGPGATLHWAGNDDVGKGTLRIVDSEMPTRVATEVAFEGFPDPADGTFAIEPLSGGASRVTWAFETALSGPVARWFGLLMPKYIGADYEKGLSQLKVLIESLPAEDFGDLSVIEDETRPMDVIVIAGSAPANDMEATSLALGELYGRLIAFAGEHAIEITGHPMTLTNELDESQWRFEAALPVRISGPVEDDGDVQVKTTAAGRALVVEHVGPYDRLAGTLAKLDAYAAVHGHRRNGPIQEIYVSDPADTPPEALITKIVYPIENG